MRKVCNIFWGHCLTSKSWMVNREIGSFESTRFGNWEGNAKAPICSAIWNGRGSELWFEKCRIWGEQVFAVWTSGADHSLLIKKSRREQRDVIYFNLWQTTHEVIFTYTITKFDKWFHNQQVKFAFGFSFLCVIYGSCACRMELKRRLTAAILKGWWKDYNCCKCT